MPKQLTQREKADKFYETADKATKAKISVAVKYFAIYFKIINRVRKNNRIVFFDLFCGKGIFRDGTLSVPLLLLEQLRRDKIHNIKIVFNDLYFSKELKENIIAYDETLLNYFSDIQFTSQDSRNYNVGEVIKNDDIVISYVDSFSYIRVDSETVNSLVSNYFSDAVFFLNINYFFRFISIDVENLKEFFGGIDNYNNVKDIIENPLLKRSEKTDYLVKKYIGLLTEKFSTQLYVLPLMFKTSHEVSEIHNALFIASKSMKGLECIRNDLNNNDLVTLKKGRFIVQEEKYIPKNQTLLFDLELDRIKEYIPRNKYINLEQLLNFIDGDYITKYSYISAYNAPYVRKKLMKLEKEEILDIKYLKNGKRRALTYSEFTIFKRVK